MFWFENVFEELNSPGEWYLDETAGKLYYVPFAGERADSVTLYAPVSSFLLSVDGCDDISFEGIRFWGSEWTLSVTPEGNGVRTQYNIDAYQASIECDAAVNVQNADRIDFCNCEFINIGNTALKYTKNCHDCTVKNTIFRQVGSTAIAIYGENVRPDAENADERISGFHVINNLIEGYGRNTYESTGVHLMYASDSEIIHNEIHDGYYTGLSCGWIWGHEYQVTRNVRITDNLLYDIGQGWLSDLGGMYLLGEQPGTIIARNVVYNVTRGKGKNDYGGNGIYTDAGSSFFTIEQNLIYDCAATGLNIGGYNSRHVVRYNVVAYNKLSQFDPGWGDGKDDDCTATCYGNIFYSDDAPVILDLQKSAKFAEYGNILWDRTNGKEVFGSTGYTSKYERKTKISVKQAAKNGFLTRDVICDPLFIDPENRNFGLDPSSPAFAEGFDFKACDFSLSGVEKTAVIGAGSHYERGSIFRKSDLSAYPNACSKELVPYTLIFAIVEVSPILQVVFLSLIFVGALALWFLKTNASLAQKIVLTVVAPLTIGCMYPLYLFFSAGRMVGYFIFMALFSIVTALPCSLLIRNKWLRLLPPAAFFGSFAGLAFLSENTLSLSKAFALNVSQFVLILTSIICVVVFFIKLFYPKKDER